MKLRLENGNFGIFYKKDIHTPSDSNDPVNPGNGGDGTAA